MVLMILNCLFGVFSCYLFIETCQITKLNSIHEFFYMYSGGRAAIALTCVSFIAYYTFITVFFISKGEIDNGVLLID